MNGAPGGAGSFLTSFQNRDTGEEQIKKREYEVWAVQHKRYTDSPEWNELRRTMPGKRKCVACVATTDLNLHHMFYPDDLYQTKYCHCCWLCRTCHQAFHRRVKGTLSLPKKTWADLRKHTRKIVLRELRKPTIPKPSIQEPQHPPKRKALSNFEGIVVMPASRVATFLLREQGSTSENPHLRHSD